MGTLQPFPVECDTHSHWSRAGCECRESTGSLWRYGPAGIRYVTLVHVLSINQEKQVYRPKESCLLVQKQEGCVCSIAELPWEERNLGTWKGPDSPVTSQVCRDSGLRFDKGGSWPPEPRYMPPLFHQSQQNTAGPGIPTLPCCLECESDSRAPLGWARLWGPCGLSPGPRANVPAWLEKLP